jgi:hypothetical protein
MRDLVLSFIHLFTSEMFVHITLKSSNKKTGPIPVTTTEQSSCAPSCPFIGKGCYAKSGPLALHWRKVSAGERGTDWQGLCDFIQSLPVKQVWRHNQAGDLPHILGDINPAMMAHLVVANTGRRGYTYTHHTLNKHNVEIIKRANRQGFTINASTESLAAADAAIDEGLPAVCVVPNNQPVPEHTPQGRKVVLCPAQERDTNCAECKLCSQANRTCVVAFQAHGNAAKTVNQIVA